MDTTSREVADRPNWLPRAFVELHREGRFDYWGAPYDQLTDRDRQGRIASHTKRVLWWSGVEWDRTPDEVLAFAGDDFLRPGLVPFAGDGVGGNFCWYPRWRKAPDGPPPVVYAPRDNEEGELFARDFAEFLVRCLLFDGAHSEEALGPGDRTPIWDAHVAIIRPWLRPDQIELLETVRTDLSPATCVRAERALGEAIGRHPLAVMQPATKYVFRQDESLAAIVSSYERSIRYYREMVEVEGRGELAGKLEEAEEQSERACADFIANSTDIPEA